MSVLYVETVHGDPTIWMRTPDNPNGDEPAMVRTGATARAFDALVEAAQEQAEQCTSCGTGCANPACFMDAVLTVADVAYCVQCARDELGGRL